MIKLLTIFIILGNLEEPGVTWGNRSPGSPSRYPWLPRLPFFGGISYNLVILHEYKQKT